MLDRLPPDCWELEALPDKLDDQLDPRSLLRDDKTEPDDCPAEELGADVDPADEGLEELSLGWLTIEELPELDNDEPSPLIVVEDVIVTLDAELELVTEEIEDVVTVAEEAEVADDDDNDDDEISDELELTDELVEAAEDDVEMVNEDTGTIDDVDDAESVDDTEDEGDDLGQ
jgi:hypothetical protein